MIQRIVTILWLLSSIGVLLLTLNLYDGSPDSDIGVFYIWGMLVLTFPCGLIVALIVSAFSYIQFNFFGTIASLSYAHFLLTWVAFSVIGYIQWFWLVPRLYKRIKTWKKATA